MNTPKHRPAWLQVWLLIILLSCMYDAHTEPAQSVVRGNVIVNTTHTPASGLTVSLLHPRLGRSVPAITDNYGNYTFIQIPLMPDPYFIEIYWGNQLIYRNIITVNDYDILLPPIGI